MDSVEALDLMRFDRMRTLQRWQHFDDVFGEGTETGKLRGCVWQKEVHFLADSRVLGVEKVHVDGLRA